MAPQPPPEVALADDAPKASSAKTKAPSPVAASRSGVRGGPAINISPTLVAILVGLMLAALALWLDYYRRPR